MFSARNALASQMRNDSRLTTSLDWPAVCACDAAPAATPHTSSAARAQAIGHLDDIFEFLGCQSINGRQR